MLNNPPCIRGLVGCDDSSWDGATNSGNGSSGGSGGSSGSNGGSSGNSNSGNSGLNLDTSGLRNGLNNGLNSLGNTASSVGSGLANAGNNLAARLGSGAERIARYTVNTTNRGTQAVKDFVFSHGPLPNGAIFDPSRSSKECTQVGAAVQCKTDLQPGESKNFEMAYKVNNSLSCAIARVLQTVKNITVGSSQGVVTTVNCSIKTESGAAGQSGANGLGLSAGNGANTSGALSGTGMSANGSSVGATSGANGNGVTELPLITLEDQGISRTTQYKTQMPRTGAADILFQSSTQQYVLRKVEAEHQPLLSVEPILMGIVAMALIAAVIWRRTLCLRA